MRSSQVVSAVIALVAGVSFVACADAASPRLSVPTGHGRPVILDGTFEGAEWDDARSIDLGDSVVLLVKEFQGHVWMGVRCPFNRVAYTDVFLGLDDGTFRRLHASAQLYGKTLTRTTLAGSSAPRFGATNGWSANETRFDRGLAERLVREDPDRDRRRMLLDTTYPYDGFEFQLKHERFPGSRWRVRIELNPGFPGLLAQAFPSGSSRDDPDTWLELEFAGKPD